MQNTQGNFNSSGLIEQQEEVLEEEKKDDIDENQQGPNMRHSIDYGNPFEGTEKLANENEIPIVQGASPQGKTKDIVFLSPAKELASTTASGNESGRKKSIFSCTKRKEKSTIEVLKSMNKSFDDKINAVMIKYIGTITSIKSGCDMEQDKAIRMKVIKFIENNRNDLQAQDTMLKDLMEGNIKCEEIQQIQELAKNFGKKVCMMLGACGMQSDDIKSLFQSIGDMKKNNAASQGQLSIKGRIKKKLPYIPYFNPQQETDMAKELEHITSEIKRWSDNVEKVCNEYLKEICRYFSTQDIQQINENAKMNKKILKKKIGSVYTILRDKDVDKDIMTHAEFISTQRDKNIGSNISI